MKGKITVHEFLDQQIAICGKSQREIAREIGYKNPNIITMFKLGDTKLPIDKVGPMAKAIGIDPAFLMRLTIGEYMPEAWKAIEEALGTVVSKTDADLLSFFHDVSGGVPIDIEDEETRTELMNAVTAIAKRQKAKMKASTEAYYRSPKNVRARTE